MKFTRRTNAALLLMTFVLLGCGGSVPNSEEGDPVPVSGIVKLGGQPAANVVVTFIPTESTLGSGASGVTDDSGQYELTNNATGSPGVPAGTYSVLFKSRGSEEGAGDDAEVRRKRIGADDPIPPAWRISGMAGSHNTVTVPDGGKTLDFDLVDNPSSSDEGPGRPRRGGRR